jgi:hypothetical protein
MQPKIARILEAARLEVPVASAGTWTSFAIQPMARGRDVQFATYFLVVFQASDTSNVQVRVRLDHGPDGDAATPHTAAAVSASAVSSVPQIRSGDSDHAKILGEFLHPYVEVQTVDGAAQWVVVELWELRHAFSFGEGQSSHRKIAGPMRIQSGSVGAAGFALEGCDRGNQAWVVQYSVIVLEASGSGATLGLRVDHSPDGQRFSAQRTIATAAVGSTGPVVLMFESDTAKGLGQFFRPVLITASGAGDSFVVEVWETIKPFAP